MNIGAGQIEALGNPDIAELDLMDQHKFSKYVDIESGLEIGFDHKKRQMGEQYGHECHIIFDNVSKTGLSGDERPYTSADFSISIGNFSVFKAFKIKQIDLAHFSLWEFEKLLVRLENSQSTMGRQIIRSFPKNIEDQLTKFGMKYIPTRFFVSENATGENLSKKEPDYNYYGKDSGLTFYEEICDYHRFDMEYLTVGIRVDGVDSKRYILE